MTVRVYRSTDAGAPTLNNAAGSIISVLDACLINGYGTQTPTSITFSGTTATVTLPVAHGMQDGTRVLISGATDSKYNGEFPIVVTGGLAFTYTMTGTPTANASGTLSSKIAGSGWSKAFSGTNLAAYRANTGNRFYFRVDDSQVYAGTALTAPRCVGYEAMTDINTGTNAFPTNAQQAGGLYLYKHNSTSASVWTVIATEKAFYFLPQFAAASYFVNATFFGDFTSYKAGDAFNTLLFSSITNNGDVLQLNISYSTTGGYSASYSIPRGYAQTGSAINTTLMSAIPGIGSSAAYSGDASKGGAYPSPIDGALHVSPVKIIEPGAGSYRGLMPSLWHIQHAKPFSHLDVIVGQGNLAGKTLMAICSASVSYQVLIEISDTW